MLTNNFVIFKLYTRFNIKKMTFILNTRLYGITKKMFFTCSFNTFHDKFAFSVIVM